MNGPVVTGTGPWALADCGPVTTNIKNAMNANEHNRLILVGVILFLLGLDAKNQNQLLCFLEGHWTSVEKICTGGFTDAKYFIGMVNSGCFSNRARNVYPSEPSSKRA